MDKHKVSIGFIGNARVSFYCPSCDGTHLADYYDVQKNDSFEAHCGDVFDFGRVGMARGE